MAGKPDIDRWCAQEEGQFLERKSAIDRFGPAATPRKAREIAKDISETLAAMANADGGELVLGSEDDGEITGVPHPPDKIQFFARVPRDSNYVTPALRTDMCEVPAPKGKLLLHFRVEWSPEVHQLADGRYVLRVNDSNQPFPAGKIAALKETKAGSLFERTFPPQASIEDVGLQLLKPLVGGREWRKSAEHRLREYGLVENRDGVAIPNLACLLLFGSEPARWHPRCGIDFVRWEGTVRKHGGELNVVKRYRLTGPIVTLIEDAYKAVRPFIRERQQLMDLFFVERLEYPTFAWQEAIVNAVAHRDYRIQGTAIEIHMFDDRIEITSPGLPPEPVTIQALERCEHIHVSRNPLIVRVLTELGYMRELGEGIPRMFAEMGTQGFYPPKLEAVGEFLFRVVLRNQPVYGEETRDWLSAFTGLSLTGDQLRILAYAHAHGGSFTSRNLQKLCGLEIYQASNLIKDLKRKGVVRSAGKRSRAYVVNEHSGVVNKIPEDLRKLMPILKRKVELSNSDIRKELGLDRKAALRLVNRLIDQGLLKKEGSKKGTRYKKA